MRRSAKDKMHGFLKITNFQKVEEEEEKQVYFHDQEVIS